MAESGFDLSMFQAGSYSGGGGFSFAWAKLTEGVGYKDPAADRHMIAILNQPIVPAGYHFGRPDLNGGQGGAYAEADWFWTVATSYGGARGMLLGLDAESAGGSAGWCADFLGRLTWRSGGYNPWCYSYWNWMQTRGVVGAALLQTSPLWLAWPDANGDTPGGVAVSMQQYGLGGVPGIQGSVDLNRFYGSVEQLKKLTVPDPNATPVAAVEPPAPPPPPPPSGGGSMVAPRPGSDRHDAVFITHAGSRFGHGWSNSISDDSATPPTASYEDWPAPEGVALVAGTAWAFWDSSGDWFSWGAQAPDGNWWYGWGTLAAANVSGWKRWANFSSDVPVAGPVVDLASLQGRLTAIEQDLVRVKADIAPPGGQG